MARHPWVVLSCCLPFKDAAARRHRSILSGAPEFMYGAQQSEGACAPAAAIYEERQFVALYREEAPKLRSFLRRRIWLERSEEHTSELQSLMRISFAVVCLNKHTT